MKKLLHVIGFALLFQCLLIVSTAQDSNQAVIDKIRIVNVTARAPVVDGVENEFTVEVEYTLESADAATLMLGFNSDQQSRYRMTTRKKVKRGTNFITLKARIVPKDWKEYGDFTVLANLSPNPVPRERWKPFASTTTVIDFSN